MELPAAHYEFRVNGDSAAAKSDCTSVQFQASLKSENFKSIWPDFKELVLTTDVADYNKS
jgi:hypothetical protein